MQYNPRSQILPRTSPLWQRAPLASAVSTPLPHTYFPTSLFFVAVAPHGGGGGGANHGEVISIDRPFFLSERLVMLARQRAWGDGTWVRECGGSTGGLGLVLGMTLMADMVAGSSGGRALYVVCTWVSWSWYGAITCRSAGKIRRIVMIPDHSHDTWQPRFLAFTSSERIGTLAMMLSIYVLRQDSHPRAILPRTRA